MTEAEWLSGTDPTPMLELVREPASDRTLRLFAVGCCRLFWDAVQNDAARLVIEINERFADGLASERELSRARSDAHSAGWATRFRTDYARLDPGYEVYSAHTVEREDYSEADVRRIYFTAFMANAPQRLKADPMPMLRSDPLLTRSSPSLLRCIFGNPFRSIPPNPSWFSFTVVTLADAVYQHRSFDRLPILADALEEAGCDNADILAHCRGDGPHVRGCWVVDLVLGKC